MFGIILLKLKHYLFNLIDNDVKNLKMIERKTQNCKKLKDLADRGLAMKYPKCSTSELKKSQI